MIIIRNTLCYNLAFIVLNIVVGVALAIVLNAASKKKWVLAMGQTTLLLPNMISMVLVSYLVYAFLHQDYGVMNTRILPLFGMEEISWYYSPEYWPFILTIVYIWKHAGFQSIIYFAAIRGIDPNYYDAAAIDGASRWQQFTNITLPQLRPTIIVMAILALAKIFNSDFGLFYQVPMNSSALYPTTNVLETYTYRALTQIFDLGMATVTGFVQSVVGFILVLIANAILRRISPEDAFF